MDREMDGESYYPDDESTPAQPAANGADMGEGEESERETSILPLSFFQGKEVTPGKVCRIKVEHIYGDEVEVSYLPHEEKRKEMAEDEEAEPEMAVMIGLEDE